MEKENSFKVFLSFNDKGIPFENDIEAKEFASSAQKVLKSIYKNVTGETMSSEVNADLYFEDMFLFSIENNNV